MRGNKGLVIIGSLLLAAAWAAWCIYFLPKGLDFTDEGFYCSEAWRFAHGDVPLQGVSSTFGLSFWWLSWVFHVYPECSLLGVRIVWAIVMLLCALLTANLMLRYFNPVVTFAGAAVGLFFATSGVIKVLSYNTMPLVGMLLVVWLWLTACQRSGKLQVLLAVGAGIAAFLATTCRLSLLPIVFFPILTVIYDRCCGVKMDGWLRATIAFVAAYLGGLACFFTVLFLQGMAGDFLSSFGTITSVPGHSLKDAILNFRDSSFYYLLPALPILILVFIKRFKDVLAFLKQHSKAVIYVVLPIVIACISIVIFNWAAVCEVLTWLKHDFQRLLLGPLASSNRRNVLLPLALAIGVVLADVVFHIFDSNSEKGISRTHDRCRLGIIGVFFSFLMMVGTGDVQGPSIRYMSWFPISMSFGLLWSWIPERTRQPIKTSFVWLLRAALIGLMLVYACYGISPDRVPYRDRPVNELVAMPTTAKLHGILTTSERAYVVDRLVEAVELNSEAGQRILAYENLPMLYYLTDRLPSTNISWLCEPPVMPRSLRESIFEDMINGDRLPQLVIRATYTTRHADWPRTQRPLSWKGDQQQIDPIDKYVRQHYKVIQEIDGFQIMVPRQQVAGP